jgi:hypothetical protein
MDCGTASIQVFGTTRDAAKVFSLGLDGETGARRTSAAADNLVRWILALSRDAGYRGDNRE